MRRYLLLFLALVAIAAAPPATKPALPELLEEHEKLVLLGKMIAEERIRQSTAPLPTLRPPDPLPWDDVPGSIQERRGTVDALQVLMDPSVWQNLPARGGTWHSYRGGFQSFPSNDA